MSLKSRKGQVVHKFTWPWRSSPGSNGGQRALEKKQYLFSPKGKCPSQASTHTSAQLGPKHGPEGWTELHPDPHSPGNICKLIFLLCMWKNMLLHVVTITQFSAPLNVLFRPRRAKLLRKERSRTSCATMCRLQFNFTHTTQSSVRPWTFIRL